MEGISISSNQNQSKASEDLRKTLDKAIAAYAFYLFTKSHALDGVLEDAPQAFRSLSDLIENLENFGECKSFLTNDQETLQKCIDEYRFREGVLSGIWHYTIWKHTPEQIKEFTKGLKILANGGKRVINDLYNKPYQQFKTTIPKEYRDWRIHEIIPEVWATASLIVRYLEDPEGYGKKLSKYLGKKLLVAKYLSVLEDALSKIPSFILQYLKGYGKTKIRKEEIRKELQEVIDNYKLYASYMTDAREVVSDHTPEALPSLATLIENLRRWEKSNLLTNNQEALREYADKYDFMAHLLGSILEWSISEWKHPPEEIERFKEGLETLAKGGEEIIEGLYRYYKEIERAKLKDRLKDKNYQTIPLYILRDARANTGMDFGDLLVNYFKNPKEHEHKLMKYVGKPLR